MRLGGVIEGRQSTGATVTGISWAFSSYLKAGVLVVRGASTRDLKCMRLAWREAVQRIAPPRCAKPRPDVYQYGGSVALSTERWRRR